MSTRIDTTAADERVRGVIRAIPRGTVLSYGEVARRAGLPGRARWVARLLSQNEDARLPWHRVLRADGRVAFPPGSSGFDEQCARLAAEGVSLVNGRVRGLRVTPTLDELLWEPVPAPSASRPVRDRRPPRSSR